MKNRDKLSIGDKCFEVINGLFMIIIMIVMIYPVYYVAIGSISNAEMLMRHKGPLFLPIKPNLSAYRMAFQNPMLVKGYLNTLFVVGVGVPLNILLTSIGAYFLTRKNVRLQKPILIMIIVTMFIHGGMIPFYFTVRDLRLEGSLWSLVFPTAINTFNLIIMRVSFSSVPDSLAESATIDGAGHITILFRIILPVSKAIVAVMALYYAVQHWNAWFYAMLFLKERTKYPLQLILREILIQNDTLSMTGNVDNAEHAYLSETIKYAIIVIATVPILCVYPFLQKYFTKGVMIGAVKG